MIKFMLFTREGLALKWMPILALHCLTFFDFELNQGFPSITVPHKCMVDIKLFYVQLLPPPNVCPSSGSFTNKRLPVVKTERRKQ